MSNVIGILKESIYKGENISQICDLIIMGAVESGSSDIHIEPLTSIVRLRYRLDGMLTEILEYQTFLHQQVIARFKIMSNLRIDESRIPIKLIEKNIQVVAKASFGFGDVNGCIIFKKFEI